MSFCSLRGGAARGCPACAASTEGGMTGGRETPSRGLGSATCMRLLTSATRLPCSRWQSRDVSVSSIPQETRL